MQETQEAQVRSLGWEDPLEEEIETLSSMLAWRILWTEEPRGLQSMELDKELDMTEQLTREDNGTPLQYSFAWETPWTEEPGGLQSMGSLRVRHN